MSFIYVYCIYNLCNQHHYYANWIYRYALFVFRLIPIYVMLFKNNCLTWKFFPSVCPFNAYMMMIRVCFMLFLIYSLHLQIYGNGRKTNYLVSTLSIKKVSVIFWASFLSTFWSFSEPKTVLRKVLKKFADTFFIECVNCNIFVYLMLCSFGFLG